MARLSRLYADGVPQYVAQRSAVGRALVVDDADYAMFTTLLADAVRANGVALHAYVVLPTQVRLLATPPDARALPALMQAVGRRYVPAINRKSGRDGPLWDRRYRSTLVDPDAFVVAAMRHIERAPVRDALVEAPSQWRWSSHRHHAGLAHDASITAHAAYWALSNTPFERQALYRAAADADDAAVDARIVRAVDGGWILGDAAFVDAIAGRCSRRGTSRPRGRPALSPIVRERRRIAVE